MSNACPKAWTAFGGDEAFFRDLPRSLAGLYFFFGSLWKSSQRLCQHEVDAGDNNDSDGDDTDNDKDDDDDDDDDDEDDDDDDDDDDDVDVVVDDDWLIDWLIDDDDDDDLYAY